MYVDGPKNVVLWKCSTCPKSNLPYGYSTAKQANFEDFSLRQNNVYFGTPDYWYHLPYLAINKLPLSWLFLVIWQPWFPLILLLSVIWQPWFLLILLLSVIWQPWFPLLLLLLSDYESGQMPLLDHYSSLPFQVSCQSDHDSLCCCKLVDSQITILSVVAISQTMILLSVANQSVSQ